ncbi:hypothetical protein AB4Z48_01055 [Cupriavidus sp. 2TAF22]|uniref:hypothetical protein n=1 Tax=unclassified Cupriavidus TaxID=2640874 RepID=UPI003F8E6376
MANYLEEYCSRIRRGAAASVIDKPVLVDRDRIYSMTYVPFEHTHADARLVLVSTTPGHTHVQLAAELTERLLQRHAPGRTIQRENKRQVELGGRLVRPNLIRMLDHFGIAQLVGLPGAAALWGDGFAQLQPLALLPYATTRRGLAFDGDLEELMAVPMLRGVFEALFLGRIGQADHEVLYVALGRTAWSALGHAVDQGLLQRRQLLGMMPVPARAGSMVKYFLRQVSAASLSPRDPVRHRTAWLDTAHAEMTLAVRRQRQRTAEAGAGSQHATVICLEA